MERLTPDDFKERMIQNVFWKIPCTTKKFENIGEVVMSHVASKPDADVKYEGIDIRVRRNNAHKLGPGFARHGVRLRMDEAASLWKALGHFLHYTQEEE